MLEIYLICLLIGSILIGFTLLGGGHDMSGETDIDLTHHDIHLHGESHVQSTLSDMAQWLSIRNIIFLCAFFGLTGSVLTWFGFSFLLTLITASILGIFSAALMHNSMKYLRGSQSGEELHTHSLKGSPARVLITVGRQQRGKVAIDVNGRTLQLPARIAEGADDSELAFGQKVLIVEVEDGTAYVIPGE